MEVFLIITAIIFVVITAIKPFKIGRVPVNVLTSGLFVLVLLLCLQVIDMETLTLGVIGGEHLQPWKILVIFFSVAYVSISLDVTGALDYIASKAALKKWKSGTSLFVVIYLLATILTVFTSNDIVILTLTPFVLYLARRTNLSPLPFLFAEFFAANTMSMLLYIGNPTNIILGNALNIGFLEYSEVMWLPAIVATLLNLGLLYLVFKKQLTKGITMTNNGSFGVRNRFDAVLGALFVAGMLITLLFSSTLGVSVWLVTAITAGVCFVKDLLFSFYYHGLRDSEVVIEPQREEKTLSNIFRLTKSRSSFLVTLIRMPWKVLPFILVLFVLVAALREYGVITWLAHIISQFSTTLFSSIFVNGVGGFFLANVINNQPMTVLMSNIFISDSLQLSSQSLKGAVYAVAIASNLGANLTLLGALAGLMWRKILGNKGVELGYAEFFKKGLLITPIVLLVTLSVLYLVLI